MELLTISRSKSARRCWRHHYNAYELGRVPIKTGEALFFGTLFHVGLEQWWLCWQDTAWRNSPQGVTPDWPQGVGQNWSLKMAITAMQAKFAASDDADASPFDLVKAEELMRGYHFRWVPAMADIEIIAVESQFEMPLVNPLTGRSSKTYRLGGKIDVRIRMMIRGEMRCLTVEHKCLSGSTLILNHETGKYQSMKEMADGGVAPSVSAMAEDGSIIVAKAEVPVAQPINDAIRISLSSGRTITASGNHPMWTDRGWIPTGDLVEGMYIASPKRIACESEDELTDSEVALVGYMIGDGSLSGGVTFTKGDDRVLSDVLRCASDIGENSKISYPEERTTYIQFSRIGPVADLMERTGLRGKKAAEKRIPNIGMSDRQIGILIGALWSTDGCIDIQDGKYAKPRMIYGSMSEALCHQIRDLLQRIGIVSRVRGYSFQYGEETKNTSTVLVVSRESKRIFLEKVLSGDISVIRSANPIFDVLESIPTCSNGGDQRMQPKLSDEIWWDKIESIDHVGKMVLYDIEVPGPHTFVANGLITHNTSTEDIAPGATYWTRLRMDGQVSQYTDGARSLGDGDVSGCLYDVARRPTKKPKLATPEEDRKWTQPKSCNTCRDDAQGTHKWEWDRLQKINPSSPPRKFRKLLVKDIPTTEGCEECEPPRLHSGMRLADETVEEFRIRIRGHIADNPEMYYQRADVVRLDEELNEFRFDNWEFAKTLRERQIAGKTLGKMAWPRNPDACFKWSRACEYYAVCTGSCGIDDDHQFRDKAGQHEELS